MQKEIKLDDSRFRNCKIVKWVVKKKVGGKHHYSNSDVLLISLNKFWEIVKDRVAWCAVVRGVAKSWTRLSD